jgi:serine/threonine protein phosphatase 1
MYKYLEKALQQIDFRPEKGDRLISVGDIIDRGSQNLECLKLLDNDWFHMVLGNHELMALQSKLTLHTEIDKEGTEVVYFKVAQNPESVGIFNTWISNGGDWIYKLKGEDLKTFFKYYKLLEEEPIVLVVGDGEDRYNVVHAELCLKAWECTDALLDDIANGKYTGPFDIDYFVDRCVWGRSIIKQFTSKVMGYELQTANTEARSITYCGHTPLGKPTKAGKHIYLDGGICFFDTMAR